MSRRGWDKPLSTSDRACPYVCACLERGGWQRCWSCALCGPVLNVSLELPLQNRDALHRATFGASLLFHDVATLTLP
jgi:hypothetical protein